MRRLLADENVPRPSCEYLRREGLDVAVVPAGLGDDEVLAQAAREGRILLTLDRDFGELAFAARPLRVPGIVYLRIRTRRPEAFAEALLAALRTPGIVLEGRFTAIRGARIQQRPLGTLQ